jgi:hypothetical protein
MIMYQQRCNILQWPIDSNGGKVRHCLLHLLCVQLLAVLDPFVHEAEVMHVKCWREGVLRALVVSDHSCLDLVEP